MFYASRCGQRKASNETLQGSLRVGKVSRRTQRNQKGLSIFHNESGAITLQLITTHGGNKNQKKISSQTLINKGIQAICKKNFSKLVSIVLTINGKPLK